MIFLLINATNPILIDHLPLYTRSRTIMTIITVGDQFLCPIISFNNILINNYEGNSAGTLFIAHVKLIPMLRFKVGAYWLKKIQLYFTCYATGQLWDISGRETRLKLHIS